MNSDEHRDEPERLVKVVIDTNGHWSGIASESLWAAPTDDGYYELRNSPFYAYGLSWGDVVEALPFGDDAAGQRLRFQTVMRRGGHRTVRVIFADADEVERTRVLAQLNELGASHEHATGRLYAIDVMPDASYDDVTHALGEWESQGLLGWELGSDQV